MTPAGAVYDAIVLAGGRARRLGGIDKPQLDVGGTTLLDRVVAAVRAAGTIVVVGPSQPVTGTVAWAREDPTGGGPVAAVAAALALTSAPVVLLLAADLPWVAPAVAPLVAAAPVHGRAVLRDPDGRDNHLAAAWSRAALVAAVHRLGPPDGASMRALARDVPTVRVPDTGGWGQDCDTWDDVQRARLS